MDAVTLKGDLRCDALVIPGFVVDRMISEANEAQLKIYLYLSKLGPDSNVTVESLADYFNYTESDVIRALKFWNGIDEPIANNNENRQEAKTQGDKVVAFSVRPTYSNAELAKFVARPEIKQLVFAAEQYMARPLTPDDLSLYMYISEELGFAAELIEYLLEYCISNNKKTARAVEMVACEWKDLNVTTVDEAKRLTRTIPAIMPQVFEAFGIDKSRQPIDKEITCVRRWTESYGYGIEIIREACQRTVMTIGKPSFSYANSIVKKWHESNVTTVADILADDEQHKLSMINDTMDSGKSVSKGKKTGSTSANAQSNKFRNFNERDYDFDELMRDIISN